MMRRKINKPTEENFRIELPSKSSEFKDVFSLFADILQADIMLEIIKSEMISYFSINEIEEFFFSRKIDKEDKKNEFRKSKSKKSELLGALIGKKFPEIHQSFQVWLDGTKAITDFRNEIGHSIFVKTNKEKNRIVLFKFDKFSEFFKDIAFDRPGRELNFSEFSSMDKDSDGFYLSRSMLENALKDHSHYFQVGVEFFRYVSVDDASIKAATKGKIESLFAMRQSSGNIAGYISWKSSMSDGKKSEN